MICTAEFPLFRLLTQSRVVLICAVAVWLTACGGGGGGGGAAPAAVPAPVAPVADAGADRTVVHLSAVTLDGRASSDPDGTIVTFACSTVASFAWTQTAGSMVTLTDADQAQPSFIAPDEAETLEFELTVTDDDGLSASDSVTITVVPQTLFSISGVISVTQNLQGYGEPQEIALLELERACHLPLTSTGQCRPNAPLSLSADPAPT